MRRATRTAAPQARRRLLAASTLAGLLVIGLTACSGDDGDSVIDDDPTSDTTPASTEPTASHDPKQKAADAAKQAIRDYTAISNASTTRPQKVSEKAFRRVAVGEGVNELHNEQVFYRQKGYHTIGATQIVNMRVSWVKLANKPNQQPPLIPTVKVEACLDVSGINVVDQAGHSVVDPNRPDHVLREFWVNNYDWPQGDVWKVGATKGELTPCAS